MEKDLNIFLGSHTPGFTAWLHNVMKKLEECAVTSKGPLKKKDEEKRAKIKRRTSAEGQLEPKKLRSLESNFKNESDSDESSLSSHPSHVDVKERSPFNQSESGYNNNTSSDKDIWDKRIESLDPYRNPDKEEQRKPRERIQINWSDDKSTSKEEHSSRQRRERSRNRSQSRSRKSRSKSRNRSRSSSRLHDDKSSKTALQRGSKENNKYKERSVSRERKVFKDAREVIRSRSSKERKNGYGTRKSRKGDRGLYEKERSTKSHSKDKGDDKLPSLVKMTPRPVRPLNMQPTPNLILKAVSDAQKSIAITQLPQPEDKLGHEEKKAVNNKPIFKKKVGSNFEPNISITLLNDRVSSNKIDIPEPEDVVMENEIMEPENVQNLQQTGPEIQRFTISLQSDDDSIIASDIEEGETEMNGVSSTYPEQMESIGNRLEEPELMETNGNCIEQPEEVEHLDHPVHRFDRSRLGPRVAPVVPDTDTVLSCLAPSGNQITKTIVNENAFSEGSETKSDENDKLIKCKFWPSCEAGDSCRFYHPKTYCRTLPNCKFGQKCLYYHPPCKFGDKCLNVTCPYTHNAAVPAPSVKAKVWTKVPLAPSNGQICMFFPNCTKPYCPYQHYAATGSGIPCKYGSSCTKLGCEFDHPQASKNPYKWVAQNTE